MLIIESLAYAGKLTGDKEFLDVTEKAFAAVARSEPPSDGKSLAQKMFFATDVMALLQQSAQISKYEYRNPKQIRNNQNLK
jgi:hypothetical protein